MMKLPRAISKLMSVSRPLLRRETAFFASLLSVDIGGWHKDSTKQN